MPKHKRTNIKQPDEDPSLRPSPRNPQFGLGQIICLLAFSESFTFFNSQISAATTTNPQKISIAPPTVNKSTTADTDNVNTCNVQDCLQKIKLFCKILFSVIVLIKIYDCEGGCGCDICNSGILFQYRSRTLTKSPDIVKLIWKNRQLETLTLDKLRKGIPESWDEQRKLFLS